MFNFNILGMTFLRGIMAFVMDQLDKQGIKDSGEVFFAALDSSGNLYVLMELKKRASMGLSEEADRYNEGVKN